MMLLSNITIGGDLMNGYLTEQYIVNYLNGKKAKNLNIMYLEMIESLFGNINLEDKILAWKNPFLQKTDLFIKINNETKRISVKSGIKNSIHVEPVSEFIHFLIGNNIERKYIISYLKYHYADGTTNGSGLKRLSAGEYKKENQREIDLLNRRLNNKKLITKVVDRFILRGNNDIHSIDAIIYGTYDDFIYITCDEIKEMVINKINIYSTGIHFGPLYCQPMNRCLNYNPKYEKNRFCIQIKWYSLFDDILEYKNNALIKSRQNSNSSANNVEQKNL